MVFHGKKSYGRLNFNDVEKEILIKKKKKRIIEIILYISNICHSFD